MAKKKYYITTPIYYVNDKPHIGHFYCTIMADTLARFHRLLGDDVLFVTGTDENSQKVLPVAKEAGLPPLEFVRKMSDRWEDTWKQLGITYDKFIRTTSAVHRQTVEKLFKKCFDKGDIYKKKYSGLYCVGCERFRKESELVDGLCPEHKTKPQVVEEENYFFKLTRYKDELLELLKSGTFALPESRCNEMVQFIKQGLEDFSISRAVEGWGIPLPIDPKQVFWVWFDALTNYITALEYYKDKTPLMDEYWGHVVHLVGKEIFRFHSILWPAFLMSAGVSPPTKVFGHGWWTINGEKMSKSLGNAIDPLFLREKFPVDALRFYMLFEIPFGQDGDFSMRRLEETYVSFLANDYGNLINRTLNMIQRYTAGKVVPVRKSKRFSAIKESVEALVKDCEKLYDGFACDVLLRRVFTIVGEANCLIDDHKPWELSKQGKQEELEDLLYVLFETLRLLTLVLHPVMPEKTAEVWKQMGMSDPLGTRLFHDEAVFGKTGKDIAIGKPVPLFPRPEPKEKTVEEGKSVPNVQADKPAGDVTPVLNLITIDDFTKVKLVTAEIIAAEKIEGADKLLKLTVNTGDGERTICAGIALFYKPEELVGKKVVIVKNLQPRKMRGVISEGMLLAAKDGETLSLLTLDRPCGNGSGVS
jgi:methionyl-tRNA synthetase